MYAKIRRKKIHKKQNGYMQLLSRDNYPFCRFSPKVLTKVI